MPNVSSFGTQTDNAVVQGTVTDRQMIIPEVPPQGLMSVGPRVTPNFVKPREWNAQTTYHFFDAVRDTAGNAYVATKPVVPKGTPLTDEDYWFLWADPDTRFDDLNETVKTFNQRISQNASAISAEVARATAAEETKAPTNHASEETIYGIGNDLNYGHVKLASDDTPITSDANAGVAATPKMVNNAVESAIKTYDATKKDLIIFGDSWSDTTDHGVNVTYPEKLAKMLGMNLINNAQSGCSFTSSSLNFAKQIDNWIKTKPNVNNVGLVVFIGGVNDQLNDVNNTCVNTISKLDFLVSAGKKVVFVPNLRWNNSLSDIKKWSRALYTLSSKGYICTQMVGWFNNNMYESDLLHLTSFYNGTIAGRIVNLLFGQNQQLYKYVQSDASTSGFNISVTEFTDGNNFIGLEFELYKGVNWSNTATFKTKNLIALPNFSARLYSVNHPSDFVTLEKTDDTTITAKGTFTSGASSSMTMRGTYITTLAQPN